MPLVIVALVVLLCLFLGQQKRKRLTMQLQRTYEMTLDTHQRIRDQFIREFGSKLSESDIEEFGFQEIEMDGTRLTLREELGRGAFGVVRLAELKPAVITNRIEPGRLVAVKSIKTDTDPNATMTFLMEGLLKLSCSSCRNHDLSRILAVAAATPISR